MSEPAPASRAPNASVLSSAGRTILVAVNGWGLERIEASPDGRSYRLGGTALPGFFAGLATGGAWSVAGGFLVQLYRDPFGEDLPATAEVKAATPSASRLVFIHGQTVSSLDPFLKDAGVGFELFAFLPSGGGWFAELRKDAPERVDVKYFSLDTPLAASSGAAPSIHPILRSDFEAALTPKPLAGLSGQAGSALRSALDALGKGPWLVRLRSEEGGDDWYLERGKAEEASTVFVWTGRGESAAEAPAARDGTPGPKLLALCPDGRLAIVNREGAATVVELRAPVEGASFTALAAAGNLAVAAWEAGDFPDISSAGIVVEGIASP
jgi:hypothetical protein